MASNTLGEWSDGEDDFVFDMDENVWKNSGWEFSDPEADDLICNINEEEVLARAYGNDNDEDEVQAGRGQKRGHQSDQESESEDEQGQYYYQLESRRKYHSKKFGMTATDHRVRFNNVLADRDLLESYEATHKIIYHLLEDVKEGMAPNDQVRFILRSEQLETPISLPFMPVERLTAERVYSALERVIQSNQEFRLNDTVTIDINHVESPQGSGRKKRTTYNIDDFLNQKGSVVRIRNNKDDMCLARALVVARAKQENDSRYYYIRDSRRPLQREKAFDHLCTNMCRSCRGFGCVIENDGIACNECKRLFKSRSCYDRHKTEPIDGGGKTVCQVIRVCEKCGKSTHINKMNPKGHICGRKCRTCKVVVTREDTDHKCYIQPLEQDEDSSYNHMLFFDFEATQEHGIHHPNLCVVHDEEKEVALFQGKDTVKQFCEWLFTEQHQGCIVVAHNFQGYDGYFITDYLVQNAIHYDIIYNGAKNLTLEVTGWDIKFIDSLNFIPVKDTFPMHSIKTRIRIT